jgi:outer membrane immunogenic protein
MRAVLLASALLGLGCATAAAADMAARPYTKAFAPEPVSSWSGFYIGGNLGYGFGRADNDNTVVLSGIAPLVSADKRPIDGVIGGAQVGWNAQFNATVFGIEADFQGSDQRRSTSISSSFFGTAGPIVALGTDNQTRDERLDWFGTVRGRVGFANSGLLWFATGGLAYGHIKFTGADSLPFTVIGIANVTPSGSFDVSQTKIGWSIGGGVEGTALVPDWTWKLEYLHLDFGHLHYAFSATDPLVAAPIPISGSSHFTNDILRVGLNYHINGPGRAF